MSVHANNEYVIESNNSTNENRHNAEKVKRTGLKALLRPLLKIVKKSVKRSPARVCCGSSYEDEQNRSNESLERKLIAEMEKCSPGTAIVVYEEDETSVRAVSSSRCYVPVHFARTEAGTFFWTSVSRPEDGDFAAAHSYSGRQPAEQQRPYFDRWVQA